MDSQRGRAKLHGEAALTLLATGMLFLELGQIVDLLVDDDPEVVGLVVRGNVAGGEGLGHVGEMCCNGIRGCLWSRRRTEDGRRKQSKGEQ